MEFGKPPDSVLLMCKIPIYGIRAITKSVDSLFLLQNAGWGPPKNGEFSRELVNVTTSRLIFIMLKIPFIKA